MADKKSAESDARQTQAEQYREVLSNAYTLVEAQKAVQTFSAITPEDLMDRFIERVEGKDTQARPNVLNRYAKVKNEILAAIEKIKSLPDDAFRKTDKETADKNAAFFTDPQYKGNDVNTEA
jgi:hypothetical protein